MFAERLRILRNEKKLTQLQAAKELNISYRAYQDLEQGGMPRCNNLLSIAEHYGVSIDWLLGRTDKREVNR